MESDFVIKPFLSVGPIKFGATRDSVVKVLGLPEKDKKTYFGNKRIEYPGFAIVFEKDKVVEVNFLPKSNLLFEGHSIFKENDIESLLRRYDPKPYKVHNSLVFSRIGIALSEFDNPEQTSVVHVFKKGYWDE